MFHDRGTLQVMSIEPRDAAEALVGAGAIAEEGHGLVLSAVWGLRTREGGDFR